MKILSYSILHHTDFKMNTLIYMYIVLASFNFWALYLVFCTSVKTLTWAVSSESYWFFSTFILWKDQLSVLFCVHNLCFVHLTRSYLLMNTLQPCLMILFTLSLIFSFSASSISATLATASTLTFEPNTYNITFSVVQLQNPHFRTFSQSEFHRWKGKVLHHLHFSIIMWNWTETITVTLLTL